MKKFIGLFIFTVIVGVGMASYSYAADAKVAPSTQTVTGDLLKIEGEFYVVKEMSGKEIRLHVDKTTALDGAIKVGDKVEVQATEPPRPYKSGFVDHAVSIKHVQPTK